MKPPKVVISGLNRGIGVPAGYVLGRLPGTGQGPAQLLSLTHLKQMGIAATASISTTYVPQTRKINTTAPIQGGGPLSSDLTLSHAASGVTAGSYTNANITVDADGHITVASNGTGGSGTVTTTGSPASGNLAKFSGSTSVTNGDLSGDVTTSGTLATTIAAGAVSLSKMANVATGTVFYRKTSGTGAPEVQTLATLKSDLGLTGTNSGDQTITLTGDVTGSGTGSFAATIANNAITTAKINNSAVTLAKVQNASANSILLGSGATGSGSAYTEITLGTNLSMSGTILNATGGGGSGTVTTTGTPASGNLAKFSGSTSITNGDLSGDVTTSGTLVTTLAASGVTAGSYTNSNITVDAKGRITSASNGTAPPSSANPTATASDTAVNGTATTFMRSDAAPAVQKGSSSQFGIVKVDGTTITSSGGVISAAGSSGGLTLIEEYVGDGSTGTHTFSSIPGTYRALRLVWMARSDASVISEALSVQFNGDTTAVYDRENLQADGTTATANQALAQTSSPVGPVAGASASTGCCGVGEINIPNYADTTFHKSGYGNAGTSLSTSSGGLTAQNNFIRWRNTSAITSLTALLASGKFVSGSKLALYGVS